MTTQQKTWVVNPKSRPKSPVPKMTKERLDKLAHELIEEEFRPRYVKQPRKNDKFNYIADIYTKWVRNCFYFCAEYRSPCLDDRSAKYEMKFARLEYLSSGKYILSYQRHNGQWWETDHNISAPKALRIISGGAWFTP